MEEAYLFFLSLLEAVPQLKWVDIDKGQLEQEKPPIQFPAAILVIEFPNTDTIGGNIQKCDILVSVRLAFNFVGETSSSAKEETRLKSLEYIRTVQAVYKAIQGKSGMGLSKFHRKAVLDELREDGLKVIRLPFGSTFIDQSAKDS
jgi:hypothetical protein